MRKRHLAILLLLGLAACDAAHRGAAAPTGGGYNYTVRKGETLFSIAEREYGNGLEWVRIHEANPWVDPDRLRVGDVIFIPPVERSDFSSDVRRKYMLDPGTGNYEETSAGSSEGGSLFGGSVFRNLIPPLKDKTLFGMTVPRLFFVLFLFFLIHATLQGFTLWLTANITFVREATLKKSLKATFLTESLTMCTLVLFSVIGLMMLYVGTTTPGDPGSTQLFPTVEEYLSHPVGMGVAAFGVLFLYTLLSLRFVPQVFGVHMGRAFTVVFLAVLLPHLMGLLIIGQRLGLIR